MTYEEIIARKSAIKTELEAEGADLNALEAEARSLNEMLEAMKVETEKRNAIREEVAKGEGETIVEERKENTEMEKVEVRNTQEYINAFANYVKTGKDAECRSLLTENASGTVPVPAIVDDIVRTAWEKNEILNRVKKTYLKGNVKVAFEKSATGAVVHAEGAEAIDEETLVLGIVTMIPESIKKFITVSDEAADLAGEAFIRYIYEELTYQIAKKAEAELVGKIAALPAAATATSVSAATIASEPAIDTVAQAMGSVVGSNLAIAMNRGTWAAFKAVQYAANFAIDIFEGLPIMFTEALPAYGSADEGDVYMIVGDFYEGAQANFPNGDEIRIKMDDLSLAESDLIKFVGREFVALGAVADKRFALVTVPEA